MVKPHEEFAALRSNIPPAFTFELSLLDYLTLRSLVENPCVVEPWSGTPCFVSRLVKMGYIRDKQVTKAGKELVHNIEARKHAE